MDPAVNGFIIDQFMYEDDSLDIFWNMFESVSVLGIVFNIKPLNLTLNFKFNCSYFLYTVDFDH